MMKYTILFLVVVFVFCGCGKDKESKDLGRKGKTRDEQIRLAKEHNQLGIEACQRGDYASGIVAFETCVLNEEKQVYYVNLGRALYMTGRYDKALSSYDKAMELDEPTAELYANIGDVYAIRGTKESRQMAITMFHSALELNPIMVRAQYSLGDIYLKMGDYKNAEYRLDKTLELDPMHNRAMLGLAILYHMTGRSRQAWDLVDSLEKRGYTVQDSLKLEIVNTIDLAGKK